MKQQTMKFFAAALVMCAQAGGAYSAFDRTQDYGFGTRAMGLAGASTALGEDPYAMLWNPAAGAFMNRAMAGLSTGLLAGGDYQSLNFSGVLPRIHGAAVGFSWSYQAGKGMGGGNDVQLAGSAAIPVDPTGRVAAGASFKLLRGGSRAGGPEGSVGGSGVDLGLMFRTPLKRGKAYFAAGFAVLGAATNLRWSEGFEEKVPALFDLGFAYSPWPYSVFCLDASASDKAKDARPMEKALRLGGEHKVWAGRVTLRMGYARRFRIGDQLGLGFTYQTPGPWSLEYGLSAEGAGRGTSHRISGNYVFNTLAFQSDRVLSGELEAQRLALAEAELARLRERQSGLMRLLEGGKKESEAALLEVEAVRVKLTDIQSLKNQNAVLLADIERKNTEILNLTAEVEAEKERVRIRRVEAPAPKPRVVEPDQNLLRARDLMKKEDFLEALKAFEKVLAANPRDAEAKRDLRVCLDRIPKEKIYQPEDLALYQKGIGHQTRGEFEEAIRIWKEFLAIHPHALQVQDYLEESEATLRRIEGGR